MIGRRAVMLGLAASAAAPSALAAAQSLVERAAAAMGGRETLLAVRSLAYEGLGWNANLLQQMRPEGPLLLWMLPTYRRVIDLASGRASVEMVRRPAFPAVFDNQRSDNRLDGDVAWNVATGADGRTTAQRAAHSEGRRAGGSTCCTTRSSWCARRSRRARAYRRHAERTAKRWST